MSDPELRGTFRRPFAEQVAAWRLRLGNQVPTARWDDIWKDQHDRAFMVAGAAKADLLADLAAAVDKAITQGTSLDEFARDFRKIVETRGWHGWTGEGTAKGEAWRIRTIYKTNMRTTYMAGRHAQLVEAGFRFWVYKHGGSVEPRLQHLAWDGLVLEADHPFWQTHFPPNGWGCSCRVFGSRSREGARRKGGDPSKTLPANWRDLDPRTGEPKGIGKGWGYAPGRTVTDEVREIVRSKVPTLPPQLGQAVTEMVGRTPPPPPAPPLRKAKNLKDAADLVVEAGLAEKRINWPTQVPLTSVNQVIQTLWELKSRWDMVPLQVVGSASGIAKAVRGLSNPRNANAWYAPSLRAMGWNQDGLKTDPWWQKGQWKKLTTEEQILFRDRALARRKADHVARIAKLSEGPAKQAALKTEWQWTVVMDGGLKPRATAIHETGHQLHYSHWDEINRAIVGWRNEGWGLAVSEYATTKDVEFVAESFVLYNLGPEHHWRIKPELLAVFKSKDRWNV